MHAHTRPVLASLLILILLLTAGTASAIGSLSGRVTEYGSVTTLQGVPVRLFRSEDPNSSGGDAWIPVGSVTTDTNGEYRFTNLEARQYHVNVKNDFVDSNDKHFVQADLYNVQVFDDAETIGMDLELREAGYIWGYVQTGNGDPIPSATVIGRGAWVLDGTDWHTSYTDQNGRYQLWLLPSPGDFYAIATQNAFLVDEQNVAKQYEAQYAPGLYKATLQGTHGPDFTLAEGGCITGRIVNDQGTGIPDVKVNPRVGMLDQLPSWTDSNGNYFLTNLPATDQAYVYIDQSDLRPVLLDGVKYGSGERFVGPLTVTPGLNCSQAPNLVMLEAGAIEGVVTDTAGTPIVGAEIEIKGFDANGSELDYETIYADALGQYTFDFVAPGEYAVSARKDGWIMASRQRIIVVSDELTGVDLVMQNATQGTAVSGRVIDYESNSCSKDSAGVLLPNYINNEDYIINEDVCYHGIVALPMEFVYRRQAPLMELGFTKIDDGYTDYFQPQPTETIGDYQLALPPALVDGVLFTEYLTDRGWYVILKDHRRWNLAAGETLTGEELRLPPITDTGELEGQVSYPAGEAFNPRKTTILAFNEGTSLGLSFGDAFTDLNYLPAYRIGHLPAGRYTLKVFSQGYVDQTVENVLVTSATTTVQDITLETGATLGGLITDAVNGQPLAGARVEVTDGKTGVSNGAGAYHISGLAPDDYNLHVTKPGYAVFNGTVTVSLPATHFDIALDSLAGSITGRVVDENAADVNDAQVVAYNPTLDSHWSVNTIGGGFTIPDLPAGDYVLGISAPGYATVQYPPNGTLTLSPEQALIIAEPILVTPASPLFGSASTLSESAGIKTLSVTLTADLELPSAPAVASRGRDTPTGCATFSWQPITTSKYLASCEVAPGESLVWIDISEGAVAVIPGNPATATFSFEVASNLLTSSTTNLFNAIGGDTAIMGKQDNSQVYVPPFALAGTDTQAVPLTVKRYGNPGDAVADTNDRATSAVYDFFFEDDEVRVDVNHRVTITLQFEKPANLSQAAFEADLKIGFFRVSDQKWVFHTEPDSGIDNIHINWLNSTVTFDASHFTRFAAFLPAPPSLPGDYDADGDVDRDDLDILMQDRNKKVEESSCGAACDLDGDGRITALDARKLFLLCSRTRCATQE